MQVRTSRTDNKDDNSRNVEMHPSRRLAGGLVVVPEYLYRNYCRLVLEGGSGIVHSRRGAKGADKSSRRPIDEC
jgi:hypothetical protein